MWPSTSSITMKQTPSNVPVSNTLTTLGCESRAAATASSRNRSSTSGSRASRSWSTFTATVRPSTSS